MLKNQDFQIDCLVIGRLNDEEVFGFKVFKSDDDGPPIFQGIAKCGELSDVVQKMCGLWVQLYFGDVKEINDIPTKISND